MSILTIFIQNSIESPLEQLGKNNNNKRQQNQKGRNTIPLCLQMI